MFYFCYDGDDAWFVKAKDRRDAIKQVIKHERQRMTKKINKSPEYSARQFPKYEKDTLDATIERELELIKEDMHVRKIKMPTEDDVIRVKMY